MLTNRFDYDLPDQAIAQEAIQPRDAARLLDARQTGKASDHVFRDLPALLDAGDLVVVNSTKVRAARLDTKRRGTEGRVEVLLVERVDEKRWDALLRPARRMRPGVVLDAPGLVITVIGPHESGVAPVEIEALDGGVEEAIERAGTVPLPPYFTGSLGDPGRYQTMFAARLGSAAAPTAGLHFTPPVVAGLEARGIDIASVDLHVGLDTFRPITTEAIDDHLMHQEQVVVDEATAESVAATRRAGGQVVAVGTTVVRALETASRSGTVEPWTGPTDLYITPGYRFRSVDLLITNFHLPRSTLLVMLEAFMGPGWRDIYRTALERGFRFLSFGDAMLAARR